MKPVTTAHDSAFSYLPNSRLPPPDQDNTKLWATVMAKTETDSDSYKAIVRVTHGTLGYSRMLFEIGIDLAGLWTLPELMETTDLCTYPGFETPEKVSKYVVVFDSEEARHIAI